MTSTPYSVSELNKLAKNILENEFAFVWVQGEISNLMRPKSGHLYFTIKDASAQISCVWLKYNHNQHSVNIKNGAQWWFKGRLSIYQERGNYQLIVSYAEEYGIGEKYLMLEQKKRELINKGWLNDIHKKPLPKIPAEIALITSDSGAAVMDMIKIIRLRMPATKITIFPCVVQGESAAKSITKSIAIANDSAADVLIVGRGGGSIEDLWAYNEDLVIEAIFHSKKPIITGIGHESDHTLSELVADYRAATPSAAAEKATIEQNEILQKLDLISSFIFEKTQNKIEQERTQLELYRLRCKSPEHIIEASLAKIKSLQNQSKNLLSAKLMYHQQQLINHKKQIQNKKPELGELKLKLYTLNYRLNDLIKSRHSEYQQNLFSLVQQINANNPMKILEQGYAKITDNKNRPINKSNAAKIDDIINIRSTTYTYQAKVIAKEAIDK